MTRLRAERIVPTVLLAFVLSSCAGFQEKVKENPKAALGSLIGAAAGAGIAAAAGGGTGAILASAAAGGLLGGYVGHKMDDRDKEKARRAAQDAFEQNRTGQAAVWTNPDTGNSGSVTPTRTYQLANGQYCREYTQTMQIGGETHETYGTACRQADGTWQVQS